ncbi:MAG: GFA family protein [Ilumatobacteraceae bacterium]
MSRTGQCLCGQITYELDGDLLATAVCHCDHCQRQSGGAFSVNLIVLESQMAVSGTLSTYDDRGEHGDAVYVHRRFCGSCGSPIYSALVAPAGVIAVKAGTLDDRSGVVPTVQAWCEHKQPWVDLPGIATSLDRE